MVRKTSMANRTAAVILSLIMALTCLPYVAFASEKPETETSAKQEAAGGTEATGADNQTAGKVEEAGKKRDAAFEAKKNDARKAMDKAQADFDKAKKESDEAAAALKTKSPECEAARGRSTKLEDEISKLKDQKNTAHQQVYALPEEIEKVEKTLSEAEEAWKKEKEKAAQAVEEAQKACDAAGRKFINDKINAQEGKDLDAMIEACKTYTSAGIKSSSDGRGNTYNTVADVARSANFPKVVDRACSYENLKKSVAYIKEANAHRKLSIHNSGELRVSYQLMGTAVISGAISVYQLGHNLIEGDRDWTFWKSGDSLSSAENLAYSPVSSEEGWDPFHGWYYDERIVAIAEKRGSGVSQSIINGVLAESDANGYPYSPYKAPWNQSKSYYLSNIDHQTGHYKALIDGKYKATGFSHIDAMDYKVTKYPYVAAQEFNNDTTSSVTIEEYEKEMNSWFAPYLKPLDEAKASLKALEKEPQAVTDGKKAIKDKEEALAQAQKSVEETTDLIKTKEDEFAKATADLDKKQKELKAAQTRDLSARKTLDQARKTLADKTKANKKAKALDPDKPETYQDFTDLKKLADEYNKLKEENEKQ